MLSSLRTSRAFLMSDHAPGCGRCAPRPGPRNGLQQLLSPLLRSFLARQTSCLQPSCAALRALRLRVGRPGLRIAIKAAMVAGLKQQMEIIMAQIGTFTRGEDGVFAGTIKTLSLNVKA